MNSVWRFKSISQSDVIEQLTVWARCRDCTGGESGVRERVVADYLREHLVLLGTSKSPGKVVQPVHIHRLRSSVRRQLGALSEWFDDDAASPELSDDEDSGRVFRQLDKKCLHILDTFAEVVHCGGGYYLPTPIRAVQLHSGKFLLIGGLSSQAMYRAWNCRVEWAGFARHADRDGAPPSLIPQQSLSRWLGTTDSSLEDWTNSLLAGARSTLQGIGSVDDHRHFDVYDPDSLRQQHFKWIASNQWRANKRSSSELWLCRSQSRPRSFWLAPLAPKHGEVTFSKATDVLPSLSRRLMYGLDQRVDRPAHVRVRFAEDRKTRIMTLESWPTQEVLVLLSALAFPRAHHATDGRLLPLPMHFEVADVWWPDACEAVKTLGMVVQEEQRRR